MNGAVHQNITLYRARAGEMSEVIDRLLFDRISVHNRQLIRCPLQVG